MAITLKGLGSGLDYESWITKLVGVKQADINKVKNQVTAINKQQNTLSDLKTNYSDLLTTMENLTQTYSSKNVFKQKTVESSLDEITAKVDSSALTQSLKVAVTKLASSTTTETVIRSAASMTATTQLSNVAGGAIKDDPDITEKFSVFVGGVKSEVTITSNETLGDVLTDLNAINGVSASISDGKLTITKDPEGSGEEVIVGAVTDNSNFTKVMALVKNEDGSYSSSKSIFETNPSASLTQTSFELGNVKEGTFKIGNAEFTIDENTTLNGLIAEINATVGKKDEDGNSIEAGVTAYWDSNLGKIILTADDEGASNILIEAGTSNFTDIMGLTESEWDSENGSLLSTKLKAGSQKLGSNAVLTINDTPITSPSNTVTSDISGIKGLTLTLNDLTKLDDGTPTTATIDISPDTQAAANAIKSFVDAFNAVITNTDSATSTTGSLHGDSVLNMIRNNLRKTATANVTGEDGYKTLASIGITTNDMADKTIDITKLVIDTNKLTSALEDDPESVMKMLVGDFSSGTKGVLTNLNDILEKPLDAAKGYFVKRDDTLEKQEDDLNGKNGKIEKMSLSLEKYKAQLEAKFSAMDTLISNLQNSAATFNSYFSQNNSNSNS